MAKKKRVIPAFGRLEAPDARDDDYPMGPALRALVPRSATAPRPGTHYWSLRWCGDQGSNPPGYDRSSCVGYSTHGWLRASPVCNRVPSPLDVYHGAQEHDEWPGTGYAGTSVRGAFKYLQSLPQCSPVVEYRWAQSLDDVLDWIGFKSPVVVGTDWLDGMMKTDKDGFVRAAGDIVGGHAYLVLGYDDARRKAVRCQNSWGRQWGERGRFWMSFDDARELIFARGGEACVAVEKPVGKIEA